MANQIQANIYQIDGNPQGRGLPNLNYQTISFPTSEFLMYQASLATQPSVQTAIQYYPSPNNRAQYTTFYASDSLTDLAAAANTNGATQIAADVYSIDQSPFRTPVPYTFPATRSSIWPVTDGGPYVYGFIEYNGKKYYTNQTEAQLVAQGNAQTVGYPAGTKMYMALLTQSGTGNVVTVASGTLTIGVTYELSLYNAGDDFTNVGAPSNTLGVKFVATGTTPSVWTNSSELSHDEGAPVANVLQNTFGNLPLMYEDAGTYRTPDNFFDPAKTFWQIGNPDAYNNVVGFSSCVVFYDGALHISTTDSATGGATNGLLLNTPITILVFP